MISADRLVPGLPPLPVSGVSRDSRNVGVGEVYVCIAGDAAHIAQARAAGAALVVAGLGVPGADVNVVHPRAAFACASAISHGLDARCPTLWGVTGTKGKTTTVHWLQAMLGPGAARVGTCGFHDGVSERPNAQTTPPPEQLHDFLAALPAGCPGVALEASSHAGDQQRLAGLHLAGLAVTGIGRDHLDYHRTQEAYIQAKVRLVGHLAADGLLVLNSDDVRCADFARVWHGKIAWLGHERLVRSAAGWRLDGVPLPVPLPGVFNAWNAAAAVLLAGHAGVAVETACARLKAAPPVPGRLELLAQQPLTYVDYAHTPESLAAALSALRVAHPGRRLALVFGCGGDRDVGKRPLMGQAAASADVVLLTDDNPRSEDPAAIIAAIRTGCPAAVVEHDRGQAIRFARERIGSDGVVLVAGKGHETTQTYADGVRTWDDRAFVRSLETP